ncbi:hypothetical protein ACLRGI_08575 [Paenarthrobacter nitroguajacolicus]|uniref:hypothetical protein n=1 Tax=Paenarthrobacter nitroguajacolicus TaxID=211146 RepID=UPI003AEA0164
MRRRIIVPAGLLTVALALSGCLPITAQQPTGEAADRPLSTAVKTSFPGLAAADGEPDLPGLHAPGPVKGQALQVPGPFDDRFVLEDLAFNGSAATGTLSTTGTTGSLLDLQILAGFYNDNGNLLGTARFEHHQGGEGPQGQATEGRISFTIVVPAQFQGMAISATLGVPVFASE